MTPTDELRRLLDERRVEWTYADGTVSFNGGGRWFHAWAYNDGAMCVSMGYLTPEQAVEATLGRGECRMDYLCDGYLYFRSYWCRECDERFAYRLIGHDDALPKYCPNCGAKVVNE